MIPDFLDQDCTANKITLRSVASVIDVAWEPRSLAPFLMSGLKVLSYLNCDTTCHNGGIKPPFDHLVFRSALMPKTTPLCVARRVMPELLSSRNMSIVLQSCILWHGVSIMLTRMCCT